MVRDEHNKGHKSRRSRSRSEERTKKHKSFSRRDPSPSSTRDRREPRRSRSGSPSESHRKKCKRKERDQREENRRKSPSPRRPEPQREQDHDRNAERDRPNRSRHEGDRRSPNRRPDRNRKKEEVWGKPDEEKGKKKPFVENIAKPDFGLSGKLAEETNTYKGVVIKYSQPPEARIPKRRWRLYPFKGDEVLPTLYLHRQSAYLIGRERKIADFPVDHPSISKQHAVLQYRAVPYTKPDGTKGQRIRPYIIDLNSANGTYVNNQRIEAQRYVELLERDVIKFAFSSREYVLLHEQSQGDEGDDDDNAEPSLNP